MVKENTSYSIFLDGVLSVVAGIALFFYPDACLKFVFSCELDGVAFHMARCIGAQMLGIGLQSLVVYRSAQPEAKTSTQICRISGFALMACMTQHARAHYSALFHARVDTAIFVGSLALCILHMVMLVRRRWPMGVMLMNRDDPWPNMLIQTDAFVAMLVGIMWMCFPDWLLARQVTVTLTGLHMWLGRMMGAWFFATLTFSTQCIWWQNHADRTGWARSRALMCFGIFAAQVYSQYAYPSDWGGKHWVGISLFSTWTAGAVFYNFMNASGKYK